MNMNRRLLCFLLLGLLVSVKLVGNNVRISGEPDVQLNTTSDSLSLTFTLSWDNSWRDNFNWDAVWLFVKYKKEGSTDAWSHLYLGGDQTGTSVLEIDPGNTGNQVVGAFVYRKSKGTGDIAGERVTLKAPLNGLSATDITDRKVYFAVSAIEMVLIPYGAYYLGDGVSNHTFKSYNIPMIPPEADIIGTSSEFNYSLNRTVHRGAYAFNAADRINNANWDYVHVTHISYAENGVDLASHNISWTVDFGHVKTILNFGVSCSSYSDATGTYLPSKDWYLLGSGDGFTWDTLQRCDPSWVTKEVNSYPVRRAIRVSSPGAYRYYRLFFLEINNGRNGFMISNVAMSEQDLYPNGVNEYKYIDSEEAITFGNSVVDGLYADDGSTWSGVLPATYPKGYKGFYIMKYELSQEQYCNFLNMLSYTQQKNRIGNNLDNLNKGDYVFGNPKHPSCRNGIAVFSRKNTSQPAVFGCNLNPAEPFFDKDDGQTLACNYMTGADMLAYLDWSGLRPMSELEYEKACRTPSRVIPGEYAWNTTSAVSLGGQGGLSTSTIGTENEMPVNNNVNTNSGAPSFGPVRCGSFGTSSTNQEQSGGSFYGVMELSGNLGEMYYSVTGGSYLNTNPTSASNNEYHGDGTIATNGDFNVVTYWNRSNDATAFSVRGGSFASPDSYLRVSDRRVLMSYNNVTRDSTVTFRGGRSLRHVIDAGKIGSDATCPGLVTINSIQEAKTYGDSSYVWYVKRPENTFFELIEGEHGANLVNYDLVSVGRASTVAYTFRRKVMTLMDEAYVDFTLTIPNMLWSINPLIFSLPCDTKDFMATSVIANTIYEWSYEGEILSETSSYMPRLSDFGKNTGEHTVICKMSHSDCIDRKSVLVHIKQAPMQIFRTCGDDVIDFCGNIYPTVQVESQCWIAENLNMPVGGSMCYGNDLSNCQKYGRLYTWDIASEVCPDGWHLPSDEEWGILESYIGIQNPLSTVGGRGNANALKLEGTYNGWGWCSVNCNTTGLNFLPSGAPTVDGGYYAIGEGGYWWTSTMDSSSGKPYARLITSRDNAIHRGPQTQTHSFAVRCIKD